jgi:HK97 gp10 family phage protein
MEIKFTDNSEEVLAAMLEAKARALESCGLVAEGYAKKAAPVDTGNLRNSISHKVQKDTMFVGTNVEYAPYVEFGTGKYYPGGRPDPWVYRDEKGNWHRTSGVKAKPFIKPSVADHKQQYYDIIEQELKK